MGQVLQVNGNYDIVTASAGDITLNTGVGVGRVIVTGNLVVQGDTLTVEAENLNVKDNILVLNYDESGPGVTLVYSGIQIDRGNTTPGGFEPKNDASFIYNELTDTWEIGHGTPGVNFSFNYSQLRLTKIFTNADTQNSNTGRTADLTLIGFGNGVVSVKGCSNYHLNVTDPDDIPNKRYVDNAITNNPTFQIVKTDTRVTAFDKDSPLDPSNFPLGPFTVQPAESTVAVVIDNRNVTQFFRNRIEFQGLTIFNEDPTNTWNSSAVYRIGDKVSYQLDSWQAVAVNSGSAPSTGNPNWTRISALPDAVVIQATDTDASIKLETNGTGRVQISTAVQYDDLNYFGVPPPAVVDNSTLVYGGPVSAGTSGLYAVNTSYRDEIITKGRALLFSMLF